MKFYNSISVIYKKVPAPTPRRWKSQAMMFQGILNMNQALIMAKDDPNFDYVIPTAEQFTLLKDIKPCSNSSKGQGKR